MIAFIDTSVALRKLFHETGTLAEWKHIDTAYASRLLPIEIGRVIDHYRLLGQITDDEVATLHQDARNALRSIELLELSENVLGLAEMAMPTVVSTLDAIHLVMALQLSKTINAPLVVATHDAQLARAARASGLDVVGA